MRTAFALLLACLLMVIGCTSAEQAAESGAPEPAVEETTGEPVATEPAPGSAAEAEPGPNDLSLSFIPIGWGIIPDDAGPGIHTVVMLVQVEPFDDSLQGMVLSGTLVWDETTVDLCHIGLRMDHPDTVGDIFQTTECPVPAMQDAFDAYGMPTEGCITLAVGSDRSEYCAPLLPEMSWADLPTEPYAQGGDLSMWVTEDEAAELIREFAARYEVDLWGEDDGLIADAGWYHYVVGDVDPILGHWGIEMTTVSSDLLDDPYFEGEESELLPDGVLASHGMLHSEYYFWVSDEQGLVVRLYSGGPMPSPPDAPVELGQDEWRTEVFRVAAAVLREMGWAY